MKKTLKINIGGAIFHIDEDAYAILNNYLQSVKKHFGTSPEGDEIIADIENRIAELLQMKVSEEKQVITLEDINEVTEIMGDPEQFSTDDEPENTSKQSYSAGSKKLYRDSDKRIIGGVCAGISAYFNIDPIILRLIFVIALLFYGAPILVYLILWIVIPEAKTTAEKLEMRGEDLSLSNIEKNVKDEYEKVKTSFKKMSHSKEAKKTAEFSKNIASGIGDVVTFFVKLILLIIGVALIIGGFGMLAGFFSAFVFSEPFFFWTNVDFHHGVIPDVIYTFISPNGAMIAALCILIIIAVPIFAIIYGGLKLILRFKANDKMIAGVGFMAWFVSLLILGGIVIVEVRDYAISVHSEETREIPLPNNTTLYLETTDDAYENISEIYFFGDGLEIYMERDNPEKIYFLPSIRILSTDEDVASVTIRKEGRGPDNFYATESSKAIEYKWNLKDSMLYLDPFYHVEKEGKWKFPEVRITIKVPENQMVYIDRNLEEAMNYIDTRNYISRYELYDRKLKMTDDGFVKLKELKKD